MKIQVLSDIHLDHAQYVPPVTDADIVVLAGDIAEGDLGVLWAREVFDVPVVYVAGNHEFYNSDYTMKEVVEAMKDAAEGSNVTVLDNESLVIDGVRFLGSTMWTNLRDAPDVLCSDGAYVNVVDMSETNTFDKAYAQDLFERNRSWLKRELSRPFDGQTVVITHHAPSLQSIHQEYEDNDWNACFVTDLEELMGEQVDLWVHGHTHSNFDYAIKGTRIVCNPRGYPHAFGGWENARFNHKHVVDMNGIRKLLEVRRVISQSTIMLTESEIELLKKKTKEAQEFFKKVPTQLKR